MVGEAWWGEGILVSYNRKLALEMVQLRKIALKYVFRYTFLQTCFEANFMFENQFKMKAIKYSKCCMQSVKPIPPFVSLVLTSLLSLLKSLA